MALKPIVITERFPKKTKKAAIDAYVLDKINTPGVKSCKSSQDSETGEWLVVTTF